MQSKLVNKGLYQIGICGMSLQLAELQESDKKAQKIKVKSLNGYEKNNRILYY